MFLTFSRLTLRICLEPMYANSRAKYDIVAVRRIGYDDIQLIGNEQKVQSRKDSLKHVPTMYKDM